MPSLTGMPQVCADLQGAYAAADAQDPAAYAASIDAAREQMIGSSRLGGLLTAADGVHPMITGLS